MCVYRTCVSVCVYSVQNSLFYRALLQKRPIVLKSLLIVAIPYRSVCTCVYVCIPYVCVCVYRLFYRALLQKRPTVLKSLRIVVSVHVCMCVYTVCVRLCVYRGMGRLWLVASINYRSLLQNILSFIGLFCKRDL